MKPDKNKYIKPSMMIYFVNTHSTLLNTSMIINQDEETDEQW